MFCNTIEMIRIQLKNTSLVNVLVGIWVKKALKRSILGRFICVTHGIRFLHICFTPQKIFDIPRVNKYCREITINLPFSRRQHYFAPTLQIIWCNIGSNFKRMRQLTLIFDLGRNPARVLHQISLNFHLDFSTCFAKNVTINLSRNFISV